MAEFEKITSEEVIFAPEEKYTLLASTISDSRNTESASVIFADTASILLTLKRLKLFICNGML